MTIRSDDPGLTAAFERYFPVIRAKCTRMLSDPQEAEDVAQETFIRLWQSGLAGTDVAPLQIGAWIYRTSTRAAIDRLRQRGRQRTLAQHSALHAQSAPFGAPPDEAALRARRLLLQLASEVPHEELEVVILSRLDRLTHAEIAEVAACSERTVRRLLQRFDERVQHLPQELSP